MCYYLIIVGSGSTYVNASGGHDIIFGGAGSDTLIAAGSGNLLHAGSGTTELQGLAGNDTLIGGAGQDTIQAGAGKALLIGGTGNTILAAGTGNDTLVGGSGHDAFVFSSHGGKDVVMNFHDGDILQIEKNINGLHVTTAADLLSHVHDDGGNAVITLGSETITLIGVKADDIHHNPSGYFTIH